MLLKFTIYKNDLSSKITIFTLKTEHDLLKTVYSLTSYHKNLEITKNFHKMQISVLVSVHSIIFF